MRPRKPDPMSQSDMFRESLEAILDCVSAWNKDPANGVIGVQTGL